MIMMRHLSQIITTLGLVFDIVGAWLVAAEVYKTYEGPLVLLPLAGTTLEIKIPSTPNMKRGRSGR